MIDPAHERGRSLLAELAARADVILTDWQLAALEAIGLDYQSVSQTNPAIVYGRTSGFKAQWSRQG